MPIPSRKLSALFAYLQERGCDPNSFVVDLETRPEAWRNSESAIPLDLWVALCRAASIALADPDFGLGLGRHFWGMPTMLGHLMAACPTLGQALDRYVQFQEIELHSWRLDLRLDQDLIVLNFLPLNPIAGDRLILDFVLASFLGTVHRLTGQDLRLGRASFAYAEPAKTNLHHKLFDCPLEFGAAETSFTLARSELDIPVRTASRDVKELLEKALAKALLQQRGERKYSIKVQEAVAKLKGGLPVDVHSVARDLGMGIRDLQLKLKQEGTTFRQLKDACQAELARDYLRDTALGIKEIAYILGFSDARAFHRAFLRWTGTTPGKAKRDSHLGQAIG